MNAFNVEVLSYDPGSQEYLVRYCVHSRNGIIRRSKAIYRKGELSRDMDKEGLVEAVKRRVALFALRL